VSFKNIVFCVCVCQFVCGRRSAGALLLYFGSFCVLLERGSVYVCICVCLRSILFWYGHSKRVLRFSNAYKYVYTSIYGLTFLSSCFDFVITLLTKNFLL
jgi:hypothetical protein